MKKKYLIFPRVQLKYAGIFALLSLVQGAVFICIIVFGFNHQMIPLLNEFEGSGHKLDIIIFSLIIVLFSSAFVFYTAIIVLHRFLGPIIAANRALQKFQDSGHFEEIKIRQTDEMGILVNKFNEVLGKNLKK